ncbi:TadE/TadG family type IV pilus assembly protein [Brenneria rubrifaciens]|uniref:Pilus assembly protein n=1 Tax=Brenneria rubrifaciens TaxID=55213 RepID=A0A4V1F9H6_9GAMM|nr:TadE family protein [Brenneria rubrifaciens]QCR07603.1 pilus assembly protein [Brenneria rubrifaciens]
MMKIGYSLRRRLAQTALWRVGRDSNGVAAVEAALIIPVAVFLIFGAWELYSYYRAAAVVERTAFLVANSLSMQRELKDGNQCSLADDVCTYNAIAQDLMTPLDYKNNGGLIISLYTAKPDKRGALVWTSKEADKEGWRRIYRGSGNKRALVSLLAPPAGFPQATIDDTTIVVEAFYHYTPFTIASTFWPKLGGERQIVSRVFYRPRFGALKVLGR